MENSNILELEQGFYYFSDGDSNGLIVNCVESFNEEETGFFCLMLKNTQVQQIIDNAHLFDEQMVSSARFMLSRFEDKKMEFEKRQAQNQ